MLKTAIQTLKLISTYRTNKMINFLQNTIVGHNFSNDLYVNEDVKTLGAILGFIMSLVKLFLGKFLIIFGVYGIMQWFAYSEIITPSASIYFHMLVFLSICESFVSSSMFENGEENYYAIIMLKMNAKEYCLFNFFGKMFLRIVSILPAIIVVGNIVGLPIQVCILYPIFSVLLKLFFNSQRINDYVKKRNIMKKTFWPIALSCVIITVLFPIFNLCITTEMFKILYLIALLGGLYGFYKIVTFNDYYKLYKKILMQNAQNPQNSEITELPFSFNKKNKINTNITVKNKYGFEYLDALYVSRFKKKIYMPIIITCITLVIESIIFCLAIKFDESINALVNQAYFILFAFFIFIAYSFGGSQSNKFINNIFENCDQAMLAFRSFRTKNAIKTHFIDRLKILLKMNIVPMIILAIELLAIYKTAGICVSMLEGYIIILTLFFATFLGTINELFIYYIFQPYKFSGIMNETVMTEPILFLIMFVHFIFIFLISMFVRNSIICLGVMFILYFCVYAVFGIFVLNKFGTKRFKLKI